MARACRSLTWCAARRRPARAGGPVGDDPLVAAHLLCCGMTTRHSQTPTQPPDRAARASQLERRSGRRRDQVPGGLLGALDVQQRRRSLGGDTGPARETVRAGTSCSMCGCAGRVNVVRNAAADQGDFVQSTARAESVVAVRVPMNWSCSVMADALTFSSWPIPPGSGNIVLFPFSQTRCMRFRPRARARSGRDAAEPRAYVRSLTPLASFG
jgi:hypothetical protein